MSLGSGGLGSGIFGSGGGFAVSSTPPPANAWTFQSAASGQNLSAALTTAITTVPNVGDLMVVPAMGWDNSTAPTSLTVTDTGSGGWTAATALVTDVPNASAMRLFFKVALAADHNGGAGITVTITQSGGSGGGTHTAGECAVFRLSSGTIGGVDLAASIAATGTGTTLSFSPASGSSQPTATDELAYTMTLAIAISTGPTGTNTFTGASSTKNLTATLTAQHANFFGSYATQVQAAATAGGNVFVTSWTGATTAQALAATFYHS